MVIYMREECKKCGMCMNSFHRTSKETNDLVKRLNVIEGQIKGVRQMLEYERKCEDVLIQVSAITKSLQSFGNTLLKSHLETCVTKKILNGENNAIDEAMDLFKKLY